SGRERVSPVGRFDIDGKTYIVGSAAGRDKNPAWVANIRKNPRVKVEIGENPIADATAEELPPAERDRIFETIKERAPGFAGYEAATSRVIPVFEIKLT
ncbi:MAG: nitroreductase family deazaflavin-dependent oxidoreductase, partial [bacterium]